MSTLLKKIRFTALAAASCMTVFGVQMHSAHAAGFTSEQKQEVEALFKQFITDNPELILQSVKQYQEDQERKVMQSAQENLKEYQSYFAKKDLPMTGNPDGDVTIVEFFDFNCGYCKKAFEDVQTIIKDDKNVRIIFQDMPILSPSSAKMTNLALAAHKQGKYFEMHKALMDYRGSQNDAAFFKLAEELGLDMDQLKLDALGADVQASVTKSKDMAQALGIRGTPGFIIGNKVYPGYIGIEAMKKAVQEARESK